MKTGEVKRRTTKASNALIFFFLPASKSFFCCMLIQLSSSRNFNVVLLCLKITNLEFWYRAGTSLGWELCGIESAVQKIQVWQQHHCPVSFVKGQWQPLAGNRARDLRHLLFASSGSVSVKWAGKTARGAEWVVRWEGCLSLYGGGALVASLRGGHISARGNWSCGARWWGIKQKLEEIREKRAILSLPLKFGEKHWEAFMEVWLMRRWLMETQGDWDPVGQCVGE